MKLQRLDASQSRKGGWIIRTSNQARMKQVLANLSNDEYRLAHRASNSYWITESALLRIASSFTNWNDYAPLVASVPPSRTPIVRPAPSHLPATHPPQQYHLSMTQAPSLSRTPQDAAHQAHCTQAAEGFVKQAARLMSC